MTITELIAQLEAIRDEHGDVLVLLPMECDRQPEPTMGRLDREPVCML